MRSSLAEAPRRRARNRVPTEIAWAYAELEHRIRVPKVYGLSRDQAKDLADNIHAAAEIHAEWIRLGRPRTRADLMVPGS